MTKDKKEKDEAMKSKDRPHDKSASNPKEGMEGQPIIGLTMDEYDALENQIDSLQTELGEVRDNWLRTRADFDNYKKRMLRDTERLQQDAVSGILKSFLSVSDDLERALSHEPEDNTVDKWLTGIELILQKLNTQLKNQGVERMEVEAGDEFDPNIHEAITQEESPEFEEGQIIDVLQPGYRISDRVIRPAMVRVAR